MLTMATAFELFAISKGELQAIVVLFCLIVAFSLLKVGYAWGGMFMAIVAFVLMRKGPRKEDVDVQIQKTSKMLKWITRGPVPVVLIVGGVAIALLDIWKNGSAAIADAQSSTQRTMAATVPPQDQARKYRELSKIHNDEYERQQHAALTKHALPSDILPPEIASDPEVAKVLDGACHLYKLKDKPISSHTFRAEIERLENEITALPQSKREMLASLKRHLARTWLALESHSLKHEADRFADLEAAYGPSQAVKDATPSVIIIAVVILLFIAIAFATRISDWIIRALGPRQKKRGMEKEVEKRRS
jgi:hypothetical protein